MAHVQPLSPEEAKENCEAIRQEADRFEKQFGFIPNSIRTMARVPALVDGFLALQRGAMRLSLIHI